MRRAVIALVASCALGAGLGVLAENGVLLGRDESGPLRGGVGSLGLSDAPTAQAVILVQPLGIEGGPVEVDEIVPEFSSPGLEILGPLLGDASLEPVGGEVGRWPPPRTRPVTTLRDGDRLVFALRVAGPGIYRFSGFTFRYRRGIRRFEHGDSTSVCIVKLGRRGSDACEPDGDPPVASKLAEVGGPADYGRGSKLGDGFGTEAMRIRAGIGEPVTLRLPIVNLTDDPLTIERLALPAPGTLVAPVEFPPHEMRPIEIRTARSRSARWPRASSPTAPRSSGRSTPSWTATSSRSRSRRRSRSSSTASTASPDHPQDRRGRCHSGARLRDLHRRHRVLVARAHPLHRPGARQGGRLRTARRGPRLRSPRRRHAPRVG